MFSSYCTLHPESHRKLIDIRDVWARPGTMWTRFAFSGMPEIYRLRVCVDLIFDISGRFMEIGLLDGCTLFPGFPGRKFSNIPCISYGLLFGYMYYCCRVYCLHLFISLIVDDYCFVVIVISGC